MIGYKGFDKDLKCREFQYEIGKTYEMKEKPLICKRGFHFCKTIKDLDQYYDIINCRICKVETLGDIDTNKKNDKDKFCTNKIKILEELEIPDWQRLGIRYFDIYFESKEELISVTESKISKYDNSIRNNDRANAIRLKILLVRICHNLDKLINDPEWEVRAAVAKQGYGLDKLINDEFCFVRAAVAKQGYKLDKLINDPEWEVRCAVADQGYGLDKLVDDSDWYVREAVANQGYGLDKLINDESWIVRGAVANKGYGLDKLINDPDWRVRDTANISIKYSRSSF